MDFTKEQLSELICKHTRKKTGYAESTSKCNTRQNYNKSLKNSSLGVEKFNFSSNKLNLCIILPLSERFVQNEADFIQAVVVCPEFESPAVCSENLVW